MYRMSIAAAILVALMPSPARAAEGAGGADGAEERVGKVNANWVRLRAGAGTQFTIVGRVSLGYEVTVVGEKEGWYVIRYPAGRWCWVAKHFVKAREGLGAGPRTGTVTGNNVRVRASGDMRSVIVAVRNAGDKLTIVGEQGDWYKVSPPDEARAYIYKEYVDIAEDQADAAGDGTGEEPPANGGGEAAVEDPEVVKDPRPVGIGETVAVKEVPPPADTGDEGELKGLTAEEKFVAADATYKVELAKLQKGEKADLVTPGMVFARIANDYFCDEETRTLARERLRRIAKICTPGQRRELANFETSVLKAEVQRIKDHYKKEIEEISMPPEIRRFTAIGVVEAMPKRSGLPGDFRLRVGKVPLYYLKGSKVDLAPFAGRKVGILGRIEKAPKGWSYKVLLVDSVEGLPQLED